MYLHCYDRLFPADTSSEEKDSSTLFLIIFYQRVHRKFSKEKVTDGITKKRFKEYFTKLSAVHNYKPEGRV